MTNRIPSRIVETAQSRARCRVDARDVRRGSSYLVVLGATLVVATLATAGILLARARGRIAEELNDAAEARQCAESALALGRLWIRQDPQWRTTRPHGVWASNQPLLGGVYTLEVTDPVDGNLANRPHDPVLMKVTATRRRARHVAEVQLEARPVPLDALQYALHSEGEIDNNGFLWSSPATISTNGALDNDGTIIGGISVGSVSDLGSVIGSTTIGAPPKPLPPVSVVSIYDALGTSISPSTTIRNAVISPASNPFGGAVNSEGVYVVRTSTDLTIRNSRVLGTLVVILSGGARFIVDDNVLWQPFRADYPALIVQGNAELRFDSMGTLAEGLFTNNFNPIGTPYLGHADNDRFDSYPSEIQGLVHVTGRLELKHTARVRGAVLVGATGNNSVTAADWPSIVHTPSLLLNPPQGYAKDVPLPVKPGTWRQLAN